MSVRGSYAADAAPKFQIKKASSMRRMSCDEFTGKQGVNRPAYKTSQYSNQIENDEHPAITLMREKHGMSEDDIQELMGLMDPEQGQDEELEKMTPFTKPAARDGQSGKAARWTGRKSVAQDAKPLLRGEINSMIAAALCKTSKTLSMDAAMSTVVGATKNRVTPRSTAASERAFLNRIENTERIGVFPEERPRPRDMWGRDASTAVPVLANDARVASTSGFEARFPEAKHIGLR